MAEKRYLKWYNKVGYGSGDIAGNVVYAFLSSFVMIYLTNTPRWAKLVHGCCMAISAVPSRWWLFLQFLRTSVSLHSTRGS